MSTVLRAAAVLLVLVGLPAQAFAATGSGPGGYTWKDCDEPDGPPCSTPSTAVSNGSTGLCSEEIYNPAMGLGFAFPFYGQTYNDYAISANGVVYLANEPACCDDANATLTGTEGRPFLAVLWDDWAMDNDDQLDLVCANPGCSNTGPFSAVESFQRGSGNDAGVPFRDFRWFSTAHHSPCTEDIGEQATFNVRLYADGRILMQYEDTFLATPSLDDGASATIGVSSGFNGLFTEVGSGVPLLVPRNPYAILFEPPCPTLQCTDLRVMPAAPCEGVTQTFTADVTGGDGAVSVEWDLDGDGVPERFGNPVTATLAAGTWDVTASVTDECMRPGPQACSVSEVVTVHPVPTVTIAPLGSTSFCAADGESVTLDAGPFATYRWQRQGVDIPGAFMRTHVANITGSYTVVVTDANGCQAVSLPVLVDATACTVACAALSCLGATASPDPACEGAQQTLTASFSGGEGAVTVAWDLDGNGTPDATGNPLRIVLPAGVHDVTAIVTDSCTSPAPQSCQAPVTVTVGATPQPVATPSGPTSFCAARGESVTLDAGAGWASHQWRRDGADLPGETAQQLVVTVAGDYAVRVVDALGCAGTSVAVSVVVDDCPAACMPLACGAITVVPDVRACEATDLTFTLAPTGGLGPLAVEWDFDGDMTPDATGASVMRALPEGTWTVRVTVTDACADPGPQSCSAQVDVTIDAGDAALSEVSGPGRRPLLVRKTDRVIVDPDPAAVGYHVHVDFIGSWYAPSIATGSFPAVDASAWTVLPDGRIAYDASFPADAWVLVSSANSCGEGPVGTDSFGRDRAMGIEWFGPMP